MSQDRFKAIAVRLAVMNDDGKPQLLRHIHLRVKEVCLLSLVHRNIAVLLPMVVQPDRPQSHDLVAPSALTVSQKAAQFGKRRIGIADIMAILGMDPDCRVHPLVLCRLRNGKPCIFTIGCHVNDPTDGIWHDRPQNRIRTALGFPFKALIKIMRV